MTNPTRHRAALLGVLSGFAVLVLTVPDGSAEVATVVAGDTTTSAAVSTTTTAASVPQPTTSLATIPPTTVAPTTVATTVESTTVPPPPTELAVLAPAEEAVFIPAEEMVTPDPPTPAVRTATGVCLTDPEYCNPPTTESDPWPDIEGTPSDATWDRIAQCESNGNWGIATGNGYYGGVQFALGSWRSVGGEGYPHHASRDEQIYRADLLWQMQGWPAWPACSRKLGLR